MILKLRAVTLTAFACLLYSFQLHAHSLHGIVTNQQSEPVSGVRVTLLGTDRTATTNGIGEFILAEAHMGDSISFEYIGYKRRVTILDNEAYFQPDYQFVIHELATQLGDVTIVANRPSITQSANIDLTRQPVMSSQELLTLVPGLFIAQHAGGGKAEQLFLRGFDIDHGTDVALSLDGIPVNMVSHAHGQGYADMHFVMPEVIEKINFDKGAYDVTKGNFATAGFVDFETREQLANSSVALEYGMFNHRKLTSAVKVIDNKNGHNAYIAGDYMLTDNYFDSPQDFKRVNVFGKYTGRVSPNCKLTASISTFSSSWNASGQIPMRAVQDGTITRFGAIDNTEGGETSRSNVQLGVVQNLGKNSTLKSDFFISDYRFSLFSNFTFFLEDSVNGDQIHQTEQRRIYGAKTEWKRYLLRENGIKYTLTAGTGFRYDDINNIGLAATTGRMILRKQIQLGDVDETNFFGYVSGQLEYKKWVLNIGLRGDHFNFYYDDLLDSIYTPNALSQSVLLPKANVLYNASEKLQLYAKSGFGYHSNDTRVVITSATENLNRKVLPLAFGLDLGFTWKPSSTVLVNAAAWHLYSEQEFVYVGDAGIVEPSGASQRFGADLGVTWQPVSWLFLYSNLNYAHARSLTEPVGQDYIPLAPVWTSNGKAQFNFKNGIFASLSYRYMGDRPAIEDNGILAKGYFVNDFTLGLQRKTVILTGIVSNIFNVEWNETQFLTESRLKNELQPVEEIHFTPGTPFAFRMQLKFLF